MEGNTEFRPVILGLTGAAGAGAAVSLQGGDWAGAGQGQAGVCRGDAVIGGHVVCNKYTGNVGPPTNAANQFPSVHHHHHHSLIVY